MAIAEKELTLAAILWRLSKLQRFALTTQEIEDRCLDEAEENILHRRLGLEKIDCILGIALVCLLRNP